jgi:hypothetical protein
VSGPRATGRRGEHGTPSEGDDPPHVFDQTNGVLGDDAGRPESPPPHDLRPPASFGVPPITSL